jgi:hypothetical protein
MNIGRIVLFVGFRVNNHCATTTFIETKIIAAQLLCHSNERVWPQPELCDIRNLWFALRAGLSRQSFSKVKSHFDE